MSGAKAFTLLPSNPDNSRSGRPVIASVVIEPRPATKPSRSERVTGFIRTRVRIQVEPTPPPPPLVVEADDAWEGRISSLLFTTSAPIFVETIGTAAAVEIIGVADTVSELFRVKGEGRG
jgi:hypothetical protein